MSLWILPSLTCAQVFVDPPEPHGVCALYCGGSSGGRRSTSDSTRSEEEDREARAEEARLRRHYRWVGKGVKEAKRTFATLGKTIARVQTTAVENPRRDVKAHLPAGTRFFGLGATSDFAEEGVTPVAGTTGSSIAVEDLRRAAAIAAVLRKAQELSPQDGRFLADQVDTALQGGTLRVVVADPPRAGIDAKRVNEIETLVAESSNEAGHVAAAVEERRVLGKALADITTPEAHNGLKVNRPKKLNDAEQNYVGAVKSEMKARSVLAPKQERVKQKVYVLVN